MLVSFFTGFLWFAIPQSPPQDEPVAIATTRKSDTEALKKAIGEGARVDGLGAHGERALHVAVQKGNLEMVRLLVQAGADPGKADHFGWTPLMLAADGGFLPIVQFLHTKGAELNGGEQHGVTSLMWALAGNHIDTVKYLIRNGAELNATDRQGRTPLDYVRFTNFKDISLLLRRLGAKAGSATPNNQPKVAEMRAQREHELSGGYGEESGFVKVSQPAPLSPEVIRLYNDAKGLMQQGRYSTMVSKLHKADQLADGGCEPCLELLISSYVRAGDGEAAETLLNRPGFLAAKPVRKASHHFDLAYTFAHSRTRTQQHQKRAEVHFKKALELGEGTMNQARYHLANLYQAMGNEMEALKWLEAFLANNPEDPEWTKRASDRVATLKAKWTGEFTEVPIENLSGQTMDLSKYRGKVVLLDFWTTWCGPCKASLPAMRRFHKKAAKEPFVLIGISGDKSADIVEKYVKKKKIPWSQFMDPSLGKTGRLFKVHSYPSYVLLDHNGKIIYTSRGWSSRAERELSSQVTKAIRKAKKAQKEG